MDHINIPIVDEDARALLDILITQKRMELEKSNRDFGWYKYILYLCAKYFEEHTDEFDTETQKKIKEAIKSLKALGKIPEKRK
jgi:hypothetical protein